MILRKQPLEFDRELIRFPDRKLNTPIIEVKKPILKQPLRISPKRSLKEQSQIQRIESGELRPGGMIANRYKKPVVKRQIVETVKKSPILGTPKIEKSLVTTVTKSKPVKERKAPILKIPEGTSKEVVNKVNELVVSPKKEDRKEAKILMAETGIKTVSPMNKKFLIIIIVMVVLTVLMNKFK